MRGTLAAPGCPASPTGGGLGSVPWYPMLAFPLDDRMGLQVNLADGNLLVHATNLAIPSVGLPLVVERWYNTSPPSPGPAAASPTAGRSTSGPDVRQSVTTTLPANPPRRNQPTGGLSTITDTAGRATVGTGYSP